METKHKIMIGVGVVVFLGVIGVVIYLVISHEKSRKDNQHVVVNKVNHVASHDAAVKPDQGKHLNVEHGTGVVKIHHSDGTKENPPNNSGIHTPSGTIPIHKELDIPTLLVNNTNASSPRNITPTGSSNWEYYVYQPTINGNVLYDIYTLSTRIYQDAANYSSDNLLTGPTSPISFTWDHDVTIKFDNKKLVVQDSQLRGSSYEIQPTYAYIIGYSQFGSGTPHGNVTDSQLDKYKLKDMDVGGFLQLTVVDTNGVAVTRAAFKTFLDGLTFPNKTGNEFNYFLIYGVVCVRDKE